jgi:hypothetical protein
MASGNYAVLAVLASIPFMSAAMLSENQTPRDLSVEEKRAMRRFDLRLPALVKLTGGGFQELLTETQNVSARGVFFYLDRPVAQGSKVEVTLTLPSHVTLTEAVRVRFTARVIRVESPLPVSRVGVAALIEEYEFLQNPQPPQSYSLEKDWKAIL